MERLNRLLVLSITAGSALLMLDLVKKQYPAQWAVVREHATLLTERAISLQKYMSLPEWAKEMAEVRGLRPTDKLRAADVPRR